MICGACFPRRLDLPWAHDRGTVEGTGWLRTPLSPQQKKLSPWTMGTPLSQPHLLPVPQNRTARVVYLVGLPPPSGTELGVVEAAVRVPGVFSAFPAAASGARCSPSLPEAAHRAASVSAFLPALHLIPSWSPPVTSSPALHVTVFIPVTWEWRQHFWVCWGKETVADLRAKPRVGEDGTFPQGGVSREKN